MAQELFGPITLKPAPTRTITFVSDYDGTQRLTVQVTGFSEELQQLTYEGDAIPSEYDAAIQRAFKDSWAQTERTEEAG